MIIAGTSDHSALLAADPDPTAQPVKTAPEEKAPKQSIAELLDGATPVGEGIAQIYQKEGQTLLALESAAFGRLFHWYAEAVVQPPQLVSNNGTAVGETVMRLERRGNRVFLRDLVSGFDKRAASAPRSEPLGGSPSGVKLDPIELSLAEPGLGAIITGFDIMAEDKDGTVLLDLTPVFSAVFGGSISVQKYFANAGLGFAAVDPGRSYIVSATSFENGVAIRSHLTLGNATGDSASIVIGHSIMALPENLMPAREFDDRVRYFQTSFAEYGGPDVVKDRALILRHRLERPEGAPDGLTDPKKPIVYYIGRSVPDRWRPYLKAAVESWQPAFEAADFTNAIIARDAPSAQEDPGWSPEDTNNNVIRWIAQPVTNAMGPVTYDPRSGEILGAHILVWPQVMDFFSTYYFVLHSSVDPDATSFPLSVEKLGELLTYVVAHEVGHTLGLRHNHIASTAFTTAEQRNPEFANKYGPSASIMAYGRFNQAAQSGDGVTKFIPGIGTYDRFAIKWGYTPLAGLSQSEQKETLDNWAHAAERDRLLRWAAGEKPEEFRATFDPRVQHENTGADRVQATRLGIARLKTTIAGLPESTGGDLKRTRQVATRTLAVHSTFLTALFRLSAG